MPPANPSIFSFTGAPDTSFILEPNNNYTITVTGAGGGAGSGGGGPGGNGTIITATCSGLTANIPLTIIVGGG